MSSPIRSRFVLTSLTLALSVIVATMASAQVARLAIPATTLAPAAGIPLELKHDVLSVIPDDALGFATVHHVRDMKKKVENLMRKLTIPFEAQEDYADFENFLDSLHGWDEQEPHAMAFFGVAGDDEPEVVLFVPVKNYKEFAASIGAAGVGEGPAEFQIPGKIGEKGWIAPKGNYAVITEPGDGGKTLLTSIVASKKSLSASCEPIRKWLGEQQAAGVMTTAGVQHIVDLALAGLEEAKNDVPADPWSEQLAMLFLPKVEQALKLARAELTHVAFAPNIDETKGLRFQTRAVYPIGGTVSKFTKSLPALPVDPLRHLSGEDFFTAQAYTSFDALTKPMLDFGMEVLETLSKNKDLPFDAAEWKEVLAATVEASKGFEFTSAVTAFVPGGGLYDGMGGLYKIDDAPAFLARQEAVLKKAWAAARKLSDKLPELPIERRKVGEREVLAFSFNVIELMQLFAQNEAELEAQLPMMKQMIGNDGKIEFLLTTVGKEYLVYAFDEELMKTVADNVRDGKPGLSDNVLIQQTAALLPRDLAAVGYLDIGGYIEMVKTTMAQVMGAQGNGGIALAIPSFPNAPPVGYSLKADATSVQVDVVVPMDLMTAVRDYVLQVSAAFGGVLN